MLKLVVKVTMVASVVVYCSLMSIVMPTRLVLIGLWIASICLENLECGCEVLVRGVAVRVK